MYLNIKKKEKAFYKHIKLKRHRDYFNKVRKIGSVAIMGRFMLTFLFRKTIQKRDKSQ